MLLTETVLATTFGSQQNTVVGPPIASANTIAPTYPIHQVTGAVTLKTITVPRADFSGGPLILISAAAATWTYDATGNIAVAPIAAPRAGEALVLFYDPTTSKWYPHAVLAAS